MLSDGKLNNTIRVYGHDSRPYGLALGEWTTMWWRWAMSSPEATNPVVDETGEFANFNQPKKVWFLAGCFAKDKKKFPRRVCTIPSKTSILIPILNCEVNLIECPNLKTKEEMMIYIKKDMNSIVKKECTVNGKKIIPLRIKSEPRIFNLNINENLKGSNGGGSTIATADGYWVFLKPLAKGFYDIKFASACEQGVLNSGAEYGITVV